MAGFDDEVCEDFVEGGYCGGEGWGEVAEGYEEGADWEGMLVRGGGGEGWFRGLTVIGAEDLALLADAGAWFGHGFGDVCDLSKVVVLVGVADR